jgi:uncharacterized protein (DUF924 family)
VKLKIPCAFDVETDARLRAAGHLPFLVLNHKVWFATAVKCGHKWVRSIYSKTGEPSWKEIPFNAVEQRYFLEQFPRMVRELIKAGAKDSKAITETRRALRLISKLDRGQVLSLYQELVLETKGATK